MCAKETSRFKQNSYEQELLNRSLQQYDVSFYKIEKVKEWYCDNKRLVKLC